MEPSNLQKLSAVTICTRCKSQVHTNVEKKLTSNGLAWVCFFCLCGNFFVALLVLCFDFFSEWTHYCPKCNKKLSTYSPYATSRTRVVLTCLVLICVFAYFVFFMLLFVVFCNNTSYRSTQHIIYCLQS